MPLTPRQERFVQEYMLDLNAAAAATRAGFGSPADQSGYQLLSNIEVAEAIAAAKADLARRNSEVVQKTVDELTHLAFSDIGELIEFSDGSFRIRNGDEIPERARRAVSSIKVRRESNGEDKPPTDVVEFKLWDKVKALTTLLEKFGLIGKGGINLSVMAQANAGVSEEQVAKIVEESIQKLLAYRQKQIEGPKDA